VVFGTDKANKVSITSTPGRPPATKEIIKVEPVEAGGSALVPYTSGSTSSPLPERPTSASSAKQRAQLLYVPPAIKRSFLLLARYYRLPTSSPPSPNTASVLNFLHSFLQVNSTSPLSPIAPRTDIEERLLDDTIRWANARGLPFADPRLALVSQSLQPVHQAPFLLSPPVQQALVSQSLQPVYQAELLPSLPVQQALVAQSLQPVHQAALLPSLPVQQALVSQSLQPVHQAAPLPSQPVHQETDQRSTRRLQILYDLPAGVDATPGSPGTVLIPIQVENSSKKWKVRIQLAPYGPSEIYTKNLSQESVSESGDLPEAESVGLPAAISEYGELPDAPSTEANPTYPVPQSDIPHKSSPDLPVYHFKLLSLNDKMAGSTRNQRPISPTGSLDEFDDTPEKFVRPPLAIGEMSEVAQGKQPAYPLHDHLAWHGYRQASAIPESEEDHPAEDDQGLPPPLQRQPFREPHQLLPQQPPPQHSYQPPQQSYQSRQRFQPLHQQPPRQQQTPEQLYQAQQPFQQYDVAASIAQSTAAMNTVAAQMANLATVLVQNQNTGGNRA